MTDFSEMVRYVRQFVALCHEAGESCLRIAGSGWEGGDSDGACDFYTTPRLPLFPAFIVRIFT